MRGVAIAIAALASLLEVSACAPDLGPLVPPKPVESYAIERTLSGPANAWPQSSWWKPYGDPQLDALIDEALAGSPDLAIAKARFAEADAVASQSRAELWPTVSANGSASELRQSLNQGFPSTFQQFLPHGWHSQGQITGNVDYNLDLFGRDRAAYAAATSDAVAARIDVEAARLSISTAVATSYATLVALTMDRAAINDTIRVRSDSASLVESQFKQELENAGAVTQAQSRVASAQADLDNIDGQIASVRNQIAALVGKGPDRGTEITLPTVPKLSSFGIPSSLAANLLGRRPDIVAARLRVEAASSRIDAAHANFYPNISLTGFIGQQSIGLSDLFRSSSLVGQIGPAISLPIFDGGRRDAAYRGTRADYDEAVGVYDRTLVGALRDVADVLSDQRALQAELAHRRIALQRSADAYRVATLRYKAGLSRYLDVLVAEDTLVQLRRAVATLEARAFTLDVSLVAALGGGFTTTDLQGKVR